MIRWSEVGAMRLVLLGFTVLLLPLSFGSDADPTTGMGVLLAYVAPALVVLLFFVLLLDALMNRVFMIERDAPARRPFRLRLRLDLAAVALLLVFWGAFFYDLVAVYGEP
ncbi:MAG: hypothetical protein P8106_03420 [Gammaproteobacteria bacterium]